MAARTGFASDLQTVASALLRLGDLFLVAVAAVISYWIRHDTFVLPGNYLAAIAASLFLTANYLQFAHIYDTERLRSVVFQFGRNEPLMNLVPTGDTLVIEARVANQDIGFIEVGQAAEVKVTTYDFIKFGSLDGVVENIAADAKEDPESGAFIFVVLIRTDRTRLGPTESDQPVLPGMQVQTDLKIGRRTILSFLTDRVIETTSQAFRER